MVNRFLLIGAGFILGGGMFAFAQIRNVEAAKANPEMIIPLSAEEVAAAKEYQQLEAKPTITAGTVLYSCPDGHAFAVTYGGAGGRAALTLDGYTMMLDPVYVAEGAQFTDGQYSFRTQGELAAIVLGDDVVHESCRVSHEATAAHAANEGG